MKVETPNRPPPPPINLPRVTFSDGTARDVYAYSHPYPGCVYGILVPNWSHAGSGDTPREAIADLPRVIRADIAALTAIAAEVEAWLAEQDKADSHAADVAQVAQTGSL